MKVLTSYEIGKKLMREDIKREIYKSEYFHKDIKTSQYLCGLSGHFIKTADETFIMTNETEVR